MKSMKINILISLAAFAIILTACPAADSVGDSVPGPMFKSLGINVAEKKIIVFFNTDIPGTPNANKITVKIGDITLAAENYTLAIEEGRLVIKLKEKPKKDEQYTVELQGGAVTDANGKASNANTPSSNKTITVGIIPDVESDSLAFKPNSNKVLTLSFNTDIEIVDKSKIRVEVQTGGTGKFTVTKASSVVDTKNKTFLNLTLSTAATHNNIYRIKVGAGALRATASNLANTAELTSSEFTYSTTPILNRAKPPYILNNKIVATFNLPITIKEWGKVKVYKDPAGDSDGDEVDLKQSDIVVNNKKLLEITLPKAVATGEVYRLRVEAGAVNEEGSTDNANKIIATADIAIGAAPALAAEKAPFFGRRKIIVPFNGPISILDADKIKYLANVLTDSSAPIKPADPKVISNNQLEIPLTGTLAEGQVYLIVLEPGALGGSKNQPSTGKIQREITVPKLTLADVKPVFTSKTEFSVSFPVEVAIHDGNDGLIRVQKKNENEADFESTTNRNIAVDSTDARKINITLTNGEKITPYIQIWKVVFPQHTIESTTSGVANSVELTTNEVRPRLTDLYRWEEVRVQGNKWSARRRHTSVVFNDKIWVLGGSFMGGHRRNYLNDVWSSADGANWTESTPPNDENGNTVAKKTAGEDKNWWKARSAHTSVVFDPDGAGEKIWVLGGWNHRDHFINDVWSSADGANWTESTPPNDENGNTVAKKTAGEDKNWWKARFAHTSVVFNKKIWVISGISSSSSVWSSTDGSSWVEESAGVSIGLGKHYNHASAVFKNKIWVTGGHRPDTATSVWSSTDGQTWTKATAGLPNGVSSARTVEYDGRLWSIGGGRLDRIKSFWSSAAPANGWTVENTLPETIRYTQAVVFKNRIWLLGGKYDGDETNKVWKMGPVTG